MNRDAAQLDPSTAVNCHLVPLLGPRFEPPESGGGCVRGDRPLDREHHGQQASLPRFGHPDQGEHSRADTAKNPTTDKASRPPVAQVAASQLSDRDESALRCEKRFETRQMSIHAQTVDTT